MRTTKELLELMLGRQDLFRAGLCKWADNFYYGDFITYDELFIVKKHLKSNKPKNAGDPFYWKQGEIAPRIEWINQQIEKLK